MKNKIFLFLVGGTLGVLVTKMFFFNTIENVVWKIFWKLIINGEISVGFDKIINSTTFNKSLIGLAIGGIAVVAGSIIFNKKR